MSRRGSFLVAAGILLSRIAGLIRSRILAHYLGISDASEVWNAAFRIPNFLQNLFGEGALSASFIPTYSRLIGEGKEEEARRLAGAVLALLSVAVGAMVLLGELATPAIVHLLIPEWSAAMQAQTAQLVRIFFPAAGLLVLSAWCLGVLNSHHRFLLSYAAPVVWNAAIIGTVLLVAAGKAQQEFVVVAAWGALLGSFLQLAVQLPMVRQVGGTILPRDWRRVAEVQQVVRAFVPNVVSRGANQISALVDLWIAAVIPGAVTAMANAQVLYTLPVSLFGMAISAAELPAMARETGDADTIAHALRVRLDAATQRLAYYIVPSSMGFLSLGGVIAAAIFQTRTGHFTSADSFFVWMVLAGSAVGLLASTLGRLYASTFYVLRDTTTPLRCGLVRIALTGILGLIAARLLPPLLGLDQKWGATGITATAGIAGWVEFALLRRELCRRIGRFSLPATELAKLWSAAALAAVVSLLLQRALPPLPAIPLAVLLVAVNAVTYLAGTMWWDLPEAAVLTGRIGRLLKSMGSRS